MSPIITALGHDPVVFEQFTAQAVPSREACLAAVQSAHAYLLLLGPRYGYQWEETGLSATHEEYRAARARGIRRVAFRKLGVDVEPRQQAFIEEVEAYASGLFRASFGTMAELLIEVAKVVRELEQGPAPLAWRRLPALAEVAWRRDTAGGRPGRSPGGEHVFEIYIRPVSPVYRTATQLRTDTRRVAEVMRSLGMVDQSRPLHSDATASHAVVEVGPADAGRRHWNEPIAREVRGVEVSHDGQICVWQTVPRDSMGTLVDEALLAAAAADALLMEATVTDSEVTATWPPPGRSSGSHGDGCSCARRGYATRQPTGVLTTGAARCRSCQGVLGGWRSGIGGGSWRRSR